MQANGGSTAAAGPAVRTDQGMIQNLAFVPAEIKVAAGTTVTWTNADAIQHTVYAASFGLNSPPLNQNATYTHAFTKPGTYHYICSIHPFMTGSVVVGQ